MHCNVEGDLLRFSERADLAFTVLTAFNPAEPEAVTCMTDTNRPYLNRVIGHWPGHQAALLGPRLRDSRKCSGRSLSTGVCSSALAVSHSVNSARL